MDIDAIWHDSVLMKYVGIALDGHEVYALTRRACQGRLQEVNDAIIEAGASPCNECRRDCRTAFPACQRAV